MSLFALFYMIFAYLLGSISSAILICKVAGLPDPRKNGSHNPGATNVLRIGGRLGGACGINLRYFKRDVTCLGGLLFRAYAI